MSAASGLIKSHAASYISPALGYLINWRSKPSVNFLHAVDLCHELCAVHNSETVHIVTAIFAVIRYCLNDFLIYASAFLSQT